MINDLALVKVDKEIQQIPTTRSICLPEEQNWKDSIEGMTGEISGWGQVRKRTFFTKNVAICHIAVLI